MEHVTIVKTAPIKHADSLWLVVDLVYIFSDTVVLLFSYLLHIFYTNSVFWVSVSESFIARNVGNGWSLCGMGNGGRNEKKKHPWQGSFFFLFCPPLLIPHNDSLHGRGDFVRCECYSEGGKLRWDSFVRCEMMSWKVSVVMIVGLRENHVLITGPLCQTFTEHQHSYIYGFLLSGKVLKLLVFPWANVWLLQLTT